MLAAIPALTQCGGWIDKFNGPNKTLLSESRLLAVDVPSDWAVTNMNKDKVDLMAMNWAGTAFVSVNIGDSVDRPIVPERYRCVPVKNERKAVHYSRPTGRTVQLWRPMCGRYLHHNVEGNTHENSQCREVQRREVARGSRRQHLHPLLKRSLRRLKQQLHLLALICRGKT